MNIEKKILSFHPRKRKLEVELKFRNRLKWAEICLFFDWEMRFLVLGKGFLSLGIRDVNPKPFQTGRNDFDDVIKKFVIVGLPVALSAILKITECFSCHAEDAISARNCGKFCEIFR